MIKIINYISILVVLTFFIGCAGTKSNIPVPQYSINQNDKLGFIIKSNDFMAHTHVANFSGFDKKYPKIVTKDIVKDMLNKQIKAQLVDLSNENFQNVQNLVIPKNEKWSVTSQKLYDKYLALGLKAILIIEEKPVFVSIPATHFDVPSTGIGTTSIMGMHRYFGVTGYTYSLVLLQPIAKKEINEISKFTILRDPLVGSFEEKSGLKNIQDFEKLSQNELLIIEKNILKMTLDNITIVNNYLQN